LRLGYKDYNKYERRHRTARRKKGIAGNKSKRWCVVFDNEQQSEFIQSDIHKTIPWQTGRNREDAERWEILLLSDNKQ